MCVISCQGAKDKTSYRSTFVSRLTRSQYLFLLATVIGTGFLILCRNSYIENLEFVKKKRTTNSSTANSNYKSHSINVSFAINTEGCSIPGLKPLDEDVKELVFYPTVKPCRNSTFPLLDNNRTYIWIKKENVKYYSRSRSNNLICCYKSFYRPDSVDDINSSGVDNRVRYNYCISFSKNIKVKDEFVKVECTNDNIVVYTQFFAFTPTKKYWHKGMRRNKFWKKNPAYNVLILGIDAVSRLNIYRTMPKTLQFLKSKGAVELLGYNKVGDNTFPNIVPMLLGIKSSELRKTCLPNDWSPFDNCPFIWKRFRQAGFLTAFGEDSASLGTFNYFRAGFITSPTDYYLHTFINEAEKNVGNNKDFNSFLCMNEKRFYDVLLNYIEDLVDRLKASKLFGFFWEVTMSHDYLNYPMITDAGYQQFLSKLDVSKYLDKTIILFVSDHGLRWGKIRSTKRGRLEERLPFVYMLVPQSFRNKYSEAYKNLESNSHRLTTPFDIHATLQDLVNLDNIRNEQIESRKLRPYGQDRSISLFLPIPSNRTCQIADIDDHWCTCLKSHKLSLQNEESINAASQLLGHINKLLINYNQCVLLKLNEVIEVSEVEFGTPSVGEIRWREFTVVIRTEPGGGIFEATLRQDNGTWSLTGTISRLNLYGDQSRCICNNQLKLFCFCI